MPIIRVTIWKSNSQGDQVVTTVANGPVRERDGVSFREILVTETTISNGLFFEGEAPTEKIDEIVEGIKQIMHPSLPSLEPTPG